MILFKIYGFYYFKYMNVNIADYFAQNSSFELDKEKRPV